ncbi:MAG: phosphatidylglycerophosphatase A [Pseudomonadota bacterium]
MKWRDPVCLIATWFGAGLLPGAPGSWGSLAALPFAWMLVWLGGPWALLLAVTGLFCIGVWAAERYTLAAGMKDCQNVVVDEVAGQWLALLFIPLDVMAYFAAFMLFRAFDILKPWPVSLADRKLSGGAGIMLDDIAAGGYALLLMHLGLNVIK